jgi:hypothetical protein
MRQIICFISFLCVVASVSVVAQETTFVVKQSSWDPSGNWRISAKMEKSMFHEQWCFAPDHTFFVMVRGDRNNLPESYGFWEQTGSNFIMKFQQYKGQSFADSPLVHQYRIEQLDMNSVKLTGLSLDVSSTHPVSVSMTR